jgi:putative endonuclease
LADIHKFGRQGESLAVNFITDKGFKLLDRNYRWQGIEIDIIAESDDFVVFFEVKTRHNRLEKPENFLPQKKQQRMIMLADFYVNNKGITKEVRFDLIIIDWKDNKPLITHLENVFSPRW